MVFPSMFFPAGMLLEGEEGGREPCSVLSCSQTLSVIVVVCSAADILRYIPIGLLVSVLLMYSHV